MKWKCKSCGELIDEDVDEWRQCARHAIHEHGDLEGPTFTAMPEA